MPKDLGGKKNWGGARPGAGRKAVSKTDVPAKTAAFLGPRLVGYFGWNIILFGYKTVETLFNQFGNTTNPKSNYRNTHR